MARVKNSENLSAVTGSVTPELREALENYRWDPKVRKTMSEAVRELIEIGAESKGIWTRPSVEGAAETSDTATEDSDSSQSDGDADDASTASEDPAESESPAKATSRSRK